MIDEIGLCLRIWKKKLIVISPGSYISKVPSHVPSVCVEGIQWKIWQEIQGMAVLGQAVGMGHI